MKRLYSFILAIIVFVPTLLYLHQKVSIYVEAYKISKNYQIYNELVDRRDFLTYQFAKETSLSKVNKWVEGNEFYSVAKKKEIILSLGPKAVMTKRLDFAALVNRILGVSNVSATVLPNDVR